MSSYKTAEELNIPQDIYDALRKVGQMLCDGTLVHIDEDDIYSKNSISPDVLFNMGCWKEIANCGTVCCIGGSIEHFGKLTIPHSVIWGDPDDDRSELGYLFYPDPYDFETITPQQAVQAIENYLTTGQARWEEILSE